ncbi:protein-L-isoaspartate(D-aspartate) O-methyltransferase [Paraburkholderia ferrariae]|uniref:protein-L-isoaspartate(D-aspartate) O-methyltransferase n=1 Tax=Paraburkholderia ferrariae TaxID=386056 RepID=UPI00048955D9|nr:protein-L-isoaspartate(D-aspartate) O-methyltransferase [Paraburkholderia ferrariae]
MTGERTRRFPLGLADLVREPRRRDARPAGAGAGETRAPFAGASKPAAVKSVPAPAMPHAGVKSGAAGGAAAARPMPTRASQAAQAAGAKGIAQGAANGPAKVPAKVTTKVPMQGPAKAPAKSAMPSPARAGTVRRSDTAPRAAAPLPASANRPAGARPAVSPRPGAVPATGAPGVPLNSALALTSERVRERMVERVRANGIADPRVLQALAGVPRHMFVDPGLATQAYEDAALPIGHQQTISKPSVVARMLELAGAGRTLDRVLEIGTGCGYQAAVLSRIARDVYSIERIKPLYERAKTNLRPLRIPNIRLHYGDGRLGLPSAAPFDAIVIAAAGFDVPQALLEQLAIGGRLVAPVASAGSDTVQVLTLVERTGPAQWRESRLDRVFFVPLKSGVI